MSDSGGVKAAAPRDHLEVDRDAEILRGLYGALRRYAAVVGALSDDPDDLVQEAIARTLRVRTLASVDNPAAYLRRAISNLVINGARSDASAKARLALIETPESADDVYPSDLSILETLSAGERAAVFLADIEGRTFNEVAEVLDCTPVAARLRASRGRRKLRRAMEALG